MAMAPFLCQRSSQSQTGKLLPSSHSRAFLFSSPLFISPRGRFPLKHEQTKGVFKGNIYNRNKIYF